MLSVTKKAFTDGINAAGNAIVSVRPSVRWSCLLYTSDAADE